MTVIRTLLAVFAALWLSRADYCPAAVSSKIQECVHPVAEYAKVLNDNQKAALRNSNRGTSEFAQFSLPNMGGRVFNELCNCYQYDVAKGCELIHKFNRCVQPLRADCPRHVTISLIDSSYGYLCNEGYNTFLESAECLMELDRQPSVKACHDETLREIELANTETGLAMNTKLEKMCSALNFFSDCVKSPIKQDCGSSAWAVIYRVLKDTTNTLMPGCQFTGSHHRRKGTEAPSSSVIQAETTSSKSEGSMKVEVEERKPSRKEPSYGAQERLNHTNLLPIFSPIFFSLFLFLFIY